MYEILHQNNTQTGPKEIKTKGRFYKTGNYSIALATYEVENVPG